VARADALYVLGYIAYDEDKYEAAIAHLEEARILHRILRERLGLARDDTVLASVWTDRSEYLKALLLLDECIENTQDRDRSQEWHCHTNAARTLVSLGYFTAAKEELDSAHALATSEEDRKYVEYQRGNLAQESGNTESAIESFRAVLRPGEHPVNANTALLTEQNLAYALAETGNLANLDEAQLHLDNATRLDRGHDQTAERTWTAAQIAYKRGELARATSLTKRYFDVIDVGDDVDRDDRIDVASLQARIELQRNDLQGAESTAQRAVDEAELVRRKQSVLALRAPVLSKRRAPYELRFIALARQGRVEEAALAFDQWQGRSVQDALAKKPEREPSHHSDIAEQITRLGPWIGALADAPFARNADAPSVLRTMREIDLFALIVANNEVWRLTANHGSPRLSVVGPFEEIDERVRDLSSHPTNAVQAAALGARLLPEDAFRTTSETLHVVLDGRLAELPVAALRRGGAPLITFRPVVRHFRLPETPCIRVIRSGHATVLGDPRGDLDSARSEVERIAALLGATSKTGAAATKAALFAATNNAVLHVATRATRGVDGPGLELADADVSALEISASHLAPSLAVLSSCDAATANEDDTELAGSLIAAFLSSGSQHVVATLLSVSDRDAFEVSTRFYRAGGVTDPVRALQAAQRQLLETSNVAWPQYTVFGPDVCLGDAPDHP
jgi:tetratricopeptide (TPR) repeat protein